MGERLYKTHCSNCHLDGGEGVGLLVPPLAGSDYLAGNRDRLVCMVRHGFHDTIVVNGKTYSEQMVGNDKLSDIQIVNVVNYVLQSWGNNIPPLTFEVAQKSLEQCDR
jgi:mono/diheme cytochrome c family protein